jgi:hypothetical protein
MKNFVKTSIFMAIIAIAVMGCKKDSKDDSTGGNMQTVALQGIVKDVSGTPLSGVKVSTGTLNVTTDSKGNFTFNQVSVVDKRAVIKFEKSGFFPLIRSGVKENEMFIEAVLYPKGNNEISVQTSFESASGKTLNVKGMKVELLPSSVMRADGSAFSGTVNANMLYLDPNDANFTAMMPGGDLAGIRTDGNESVLVSYGMSNVELTDNQGNPLQLKTGTLSEVTFPIPAGMNDNPPPTIPLWHFDEEKGIWIEDGVATLQGDVYVGTVAHFSWVNLDDPKKVVTLNGKVVCDDNKPVPYVKVTVGQTAAFTGSNGQWTARVPEYTPVVVSVTANGGSDSHNVPGYPGGTTQTVPDLKIPCGGGDGGEPGTYTETEKGAVKYSINGEYWAVTFDNNGKRFRWDFFEEEEQQESYSTYIINHLTKTFWLGSDGEWYDDYVTYDESWTFDYPFTVDEKAMAQYLQPESTTIAGKSCKVYKISVEGYEVIQASWNGLMMLYEVNGEVALLAVAATLNVPEVAFTKTFTVSWL